MPHVLDNIEQSLLSRLEKSLDHAIRADFCVGYFNLRGWRNISARVDEFEGGDGKRVRLLVGMPTTDDNEIRAWLRQGVDTDSVTQSRAIELRRELVRSFRDQLQRGAPSATDESALQQLARQLRNGKLVVKLFTRHPLHAKLYLAHFANGVTERVGFVGSSNLTMAGLQSQGELNVELPDVDDTGKLARWFDDRWDDRRSLDITTDLIAVLDESWARETLLPPHYIYLKIAYHLSRDTREGIEKYLLPDDLRKILFPFQATAAQTLAELLEDRGVMILGDVVGLGKSLMACAVARLLDEKTLIVCPPSLRSMWKHYDDTYDLRAKVIATSEVARGALTELHRHRLVIVDESHNLRNPETETYKKLRDYIHENADHCLLLSATPYNKQYLDLAAQLGLKLDRERPLKRSPRPERLIAQLGIETFASKFQCPPDSLAAFEKSEYPDDWRDLMRHYMVRRTRSWVIDSHAETDPETGRKYLLMADGRRSYFPTRVPKTVKFAVDESDPADQYGRLYNDHVVDTIDSLFLPRYALYFYLEQAALDNARKDQLEIIEDLARARARLIGFCRSNLFKRLESSGQAFLQSLDNHILRNHIFLHALKHGHDIPIGTQTDKDIHVDADDDADRYFLSLDDSATALPQDSVEARAARAYHALSKSAGKRFRWLPASFFKPELAEYLQRDADLLAAILHSAGTWRPAEDTKLHELIRLAGEHHPDEKILVFSQFHDTIAYLHEQLTAAGIRHVATATGETTDVATAVKLFSPRSMGHTLARAETETRVLLATDVLSEGQNLQDCSIVVNYDLPWAIIRLIQRAGRVDRIGTTADSINCYTFVPADGVEKLLKLRARVRRRLNENAEVVGTDERFLDEEKERKGVLNIYAGDPTALDEVRADNDTDLSSRAYAVWKAAITRDPSLERTIEHLPDVVYATRTRTPTDDTPEGAIVFVRDDDGVETLSLANASGEIISRQETRIFELAACEPDTPAVPRLDNHHDIVAAAVAATRKRTASPGQTGSKRDVRNKVLNALEEHIEANRDSLFLSPDAKKAHEQLFHHTLSSHARDIFRQHARHHTKPEKLADLAIAFYREGKLCNVRGRGEHADPEVICSLGLRQP